MLWLQEVERLLQAGEKLIMVTVSHVRGHAPREVGAKMLVSRQGIFGTVGGGNLEAEAIKKALELLNLKRASAESLSLKLSEKAASLAVQCCGGEVTLLFEPIFPERQSVAIFGVGHVGFELAHILKRLDIDLYLIDSRAEMLTERLNALDHDAKARIFKHHQPIPESFIAELAPESHLVIMTHDHLHDLAIVDMALRRDLGFFGVIGSSPKLNTFRQKLLCEGFSEQELKRITSPIGDRNIHSKAPEMIAIGIAAQLALHLS
ncbi:MAG: xanthine dehydrogenase accessory protein XdhC [Deinococcales bacterium]